MNTQHMASTFPGGSLGPPCSGGNLHVAGVGVPSEQFGDVGADQIETGSLDPCLLSHSELTGKLHASPAALVDPGDDVDRLMHVHRTPVPETEGPGDGEHAFGENPAQTRISSRAVAATPPWSEIPAPGTRVSA